MDNKVFSAVLLIYSQMEDKQKPIASSVKKIFKITVCYFCYHPYYFSFSWS